MAHKAHHSKRRLAPGAVLLGLGLLLSACSSGSTSSAASGSSDDAVNIGVIYPKTGQYAEYGRLFEQGFELAAKKVNADGGVQGKELGLKYFDTQSDPKQSAAVAPKLVADPSHHRGRGRLLVGFLDGGLAHLPAGRPGALRLQQLLTHVPGDW